METNNQTNQVENLFFKRIKEFTPYQLHVLFNNLYGFIVYVENDKYYIKYNTNEFRYLDKECSLLHYIKQAKIKYDKINKL